MSQALTIAYLIYLLFSALALNMSFFVGRKARTPLSAWVLLFQSGIFLTILSGAIAYYAIANILSLNPFELGASLELFDRSPGVFFVVVALKSAGVLSCLFAQGVFCHLAEGGFSRRRKAWTGASILASAAWTLVANVYALLMPPERRTAPNALDIAVLALAVLSSLAIYANIALSGVYWLKRRKRVPPGPDRALGDGIFSGGAFLAASMLLEIGLFASDAFLHFLDDGLKGYISALIGGPFAVFILFELGIMRYSGHFIASLSGARSDPPPREEPRPVPAALAEGWADSWAERYGLTSREAEIARLLASGVPNKAICAELSISHNTVKNHVAKVFAKVGIRSRFELVAKLREPSGS